MGDKVWRCNLGPGFGSVRERSTTILVVVGCCELPVV